MKASEVLAGAARLLLEKGWTQRRLARTADGTPTEPSDPNAAMFCAVGAIGRVAGKQRDDARAILAVAIDNPFVSSDWNDDDARTRDDVVRGLDAAYVLALQEEGLEPSDVLK